MAEQKKICLIMIVKNESKIITRMLDSISPIIDYVSISDTGSTDDTIKKIEKWCEENKKEYKISEDKFVNFGYNRTNSYKKALENFPDADYDVLSDADFIWKITDKFKKELLFDNGYNVLQDSGNFDNWNLRFLCRKKLWKCVGVTHELWIRNDEKEKYNYKHLSSIYIIDKHDGGSKSDKFERDERLLKNGLKEETDEKIKCRYKFYLAETLYNLKKYEEAIEMYTLRMNVEPEYSYFQEVYFSAYKIGIAYKNIAKELEEKEGNKEDIEKAYENSVKNFLHAFHLDCQRSDSLYELTKMYRERGMNNEAYKIAQIGEKIQLPTNKLFLQTGYYKYGFDYELSIVCFYVDNKKNEGLEASERLLNKRGQIPSSIIKMVEKNIGHYL